MFQLRKYTAPDFTQPRFQTAPEAVCAPAPKDGVAPENYHAMSIFPEYFHLDSQAGAPPDGFSVNGQNWGFPTYNWDRMIADGCQWWVRRFQNEMPGRINERLLTAREISPQKEDHTLAML